VARPAGPLDSRSVLTQPLRKLHRRVMIVLAVLLPAAFVAGLAARKSPAPANPRIHRETLLGNRP